MNSYTNASAVTPSDTTTFAPAKALYIGVSGNVKVQMAGGGNAVVTFTAVPVGLLPVEVIQVFGTSDTTATNILALR